MKTQLPKSISTVGQAKIFLFSLIVNDESFHPEDNPFDIIWANEPEPSKEEKHWLSSLMTDIYNLPDVVAKKFDPCEFIIDHSNLKKVSWVEILYEISKAIVLEEQKDENIQSEMVLSTRNEMGSSGIYELVIALTDEFYAIHGDTVWGEGLVCSDLIEGFINLKFNGDE